MKYISVLVLLLFSLNSFPQSDVIIRHLDFLVIQADSLDIKIDSIMILVTGGSVTRLFLNDLSDVIKQKLNEQNIAVSYFYLGKTAEDGKKSSIN